MPVVKHHCQEVNEVPLQASEVVSATVRVPRVPLDIVGTVWGSFISYENLMVFIISVGGTRIRSRCLGWRFDIQYVKGVIPRPD